MALDRDEYQRLIVSSFKELGRKFAMEKLLAKFPFFALPVVNPIFSWLVGQVVSAIVDAVEMQAFFLYTDFRVSRQGRVFLEALKRHDSLSGKERSDAEAEVISAFRDLARFNR